MSVPLRSLPPRPHLGFYRKESKSLLQELRAAVPEAWRRLRAHHPRLRQRDDAALRLTRFTLADAQLVIAREHGFDSWPKFAAHVERQQAPSAQVREAHPLDAFLEAAVWHGSLDRAAAILRSHPDIARSGIAAAAVLGDAAAVEAYLAADPALATAQCGPRAWDPLTWLCFSKYLRLEPARSAGFLGAARALLAAGASAQTGFFDSTHTPQPQLESVLYAAAGVAHHEPLTRLLLAHGADPNDEEAMYHSPESYDNGAMQALVETGRMTAENLASMLLRKHDWHDHDGVRWLLEHGADPNQRTRWSGRTPLMQAVLRDNDRATIELDVNHGGDPALESNGLSAMALAARRGRADVLGLFEESGFEIELHGLDRLLAACARRDEEQARAIAKEEPELVAQLRANGGKPLAEFAGVGNTGGVRLLLDLGVDPAARFTDIDGYWDLAADTTALYVAAWRARHATVQLLLERGAPAGALDAKGRGPLLAAVRACVDSYWTEMRAPESVRVLLDAGARPDADFPFPCGYAEVDALLAPFCGG